MVILWAGKQQLKLNIIHLLDKIFKFSVFLWMFFSFFPYDSTKQYSIVYCFMIRGICIVGQMNSLNYTYNPWQGMYKKIQVLFDCSSTI